ncbi:hypothetical protein Ahy_A07g036883 isoform C [Arachis hypogaea]|uniref:Protein FAR1-RELATED SEQUENCE n=1 Tax=Arachis hypogaea TaxID=3818 RepID=A0A445CH69_ARAHY|nr:hypothetical protein Ahy_A07g036883 isoform C [Arachis hypogaea]
MQDALSCGMGFYSCIYLNLFWQLEESRLGVKIIQIDDHLYLPQLYWYNSVFGYFVGVNHHGQSTLLGCVLIKNKDIQSFKWLFEYWLYCMGENDQKGFLSINVHRCERTIETCRPTTIYRNWNDFLMKYGVGGNNWLSELFEDRHLRISIYLDHHVWTRMKSTQSSERSRKQKEKEFHVADFHTIIPCATKSSIEAQFQHVYIHEKFREVQEQFREKLNILDGGSIIQPSFSPYDA